MLITFLLNNHRYYAELTLAFVIRRFICLNNICKMEDFSVTVSGTEIPDESILLERLQEALSRGNKKVHLINGHEIETNGQVRLLTGPIVGKVTETTAVIMIEIIGGPEDKILPVECFLFDITSDPNSLAVMSLKKDVRIKQPTVFHFDDLNPNTRYRAIFAGLCKFHATNRMAEFRTESSETLSSFRLMAVSCDRPSRLLLGQQNPWQHMLRRLKGVDLVLHLGDQVYPDNEDMAHADGIFNQIYDGLNEQKKDIMMKRGLELWRNKYREVFSSDGKVS